MRQSQNKEKPDFFALLSGAYITFLVILKGENASALNYQVFHDFFKNKDFNIKTIEDLLKSGHERQMQILAGIFLDDRGHENTTTFASDLYWAIQKALRDLKIEEDNNNQESSYEIKNKDNVPKIEQEFVVSSGNNNNNNSNSLTQNGKKSLVNTEIGLKDRAISNLESKFLFADDELDKNNIYIEKFKKNFKEICNNGAFEQGKLMNFDQFFLGKLEESVMKERINSFNAEYSKILGGFNQESAQALFKSIYLESGEILKQHLKIGKAIVLSGSLDEDENYKTNLKKLKSINWFVNWFINHAFDLTFFRQEWVNEVENDFKEIKSKCEKYIESSKEDVEKSLKSFEEAKDEFNELKRQVGALLEIHNKTNQDVYTIEDLLILLREKKLESWILSGEERQNVNSIKKAYRPWITNMTSLLKGLNDVKLERCSFQKIRKITDEAEAKFTVYIHLIDHNAEKIGKINDWTKKDKSEAFLELKNIQLEIRLLNKTINEKNLPAFHDLVFVYISLCEEIEGKLERLNKPSTLGMSDGALLELHTKFLELKKTIDNEPKLGEEELNQLQSNFDEKIQKLNDLKEQFKNLQSLVNTTWQQEANRQDYHVSPKNEKMLRALGRCRIDKITPVIVKLNKIQDSSLSELEQLLAKYQDLLLEVKQEVDQIIQPKVDPIELVVDQTISEVAGIAAHIGKGMWEPQPNLSNSKSQGEISPPSP